VGPGQARQQAIDNSTNDYITFIDAGDIFISQEVQVEMAQKVYENPDTNVFFWLYYYKDKLVTHANNRMHGKVYKRQFLEKYHVRFSPAGSRMNEDIGFNRACRIISREIEVPILQFDTPVIHWIYNENSLTQKDDQAALYRDQTMGLAINSINCIETCRRNGFDTRPEINQIAAHLYYWFIETLVHRPEFAQRSWDGARLFYLHYSRDIIVANTNI